MTKPRKSDNLPSPERIRELKEEQKLIDEIFSRSVSYEAAVANLVAERFSLREAMFMAARRFPQKKEETRASSR